MSMDTTLLKRLRAPFIYDDRAVIFALKIEYFKYLYIAKIYLYLGYFLLS